MILPTPHSRCTLSFFAACISLLYLYSISTVSLLHLYSISTPSLLLHTSSSSSIFALDSRLDVGFFFPRAPTAPCDCASREAFFALQQAISSTSPSISCFIAPDLDSPELVQYNILRRSPGRGSFIRDDSPDEYPTSLKSIPSPKQQSRVYAPYREREQEQERLLEKPVRISTAAGRVGATYHTGLPQ